MTYRFNRYFIFYDINFIIFLLKDICLLEVTGLCNERNDRFLPQSLGSYDRVALHHSPSALKLPQTVNKLK